MRHVIKTPAGKTPIRSVSLALDGSCLVAGNNKVKFPIILPSATLNVISRVNAMYGKSTKRVLDYRGFKPSRLSMLITSTSLDVCSVQMPSDLFPLTAAVLVH